MEHPGLNILTIKKELTLEQVQGKVAELNKRMSFAYSIGHQDMIDQISMMLEVYNRAQFEMLDEMFGDAGVDPAGKIDIS